MVYSLHYLVNITFYLNFKMGFNSKTNFYYYMIGLKLFTNEVKDSS